MYIIKFLHYSWLRFPFAIIYFHQHVHIFIFQAGIIEEMLEDTFESMEDGEEMEEAAEEEVDKILFEITAGEEIC